MFTCRLFILCISCVVRARCHENFPLIPWAAVEAEASHVTPQRILSKGEQSMQVEDERIVYSIIGFFPLWIITSAGHSLLRNALFRGCAMAIWDSWVHLIFQPTKNISGFSDAAAALKMVGHHFMSLFLHCSSLELVCAITVSPRDHKSRVSLLLIWHEKLLSMS